MATSPDHPELAFVQARYYTKGRPDGPPLWIVIHDMEAGESSTRAESTAAYFATMPDGRRVSSHYCVDNDSVVQCVRLGDVAWTVGNRPGNYRGINWELSGFARQTREQWLDEFGRAMFARMVPIIRADAAEYGIPLRRCSIEDLIERRPGITSHNDLRVAFAGTTHTDPGPNFPWDYLLGLLNPTPPQGEEDTMLFRAQLSDGTRLVGNGQESWPFDGNKEQWENLGWAITHPGAVLSYGTAPADYYYPIIGQPVTDEPPAQVVLTPEDREAIVTDLHQALQPDLDEVGEEARDAVGDLAEGGAKQVREDADA